MHLTKSIIDHAQYDRQPRKLNDGRVAWPRLILWDDEIAGLGLRVYPSGKKTFVLSYRASHRSRLLTLGRYGVYTLKQARKEALIRLGSIASGADPLDKNCAANKILVRELASRYLNEHAELKKKPASIVNDRQMLRDYVLPAIGQLEVGDVERHHLASLHHSLRDKRTTANRVLALCSKMFNLAEKWGIRAGGTNPCRHVERFKEIPRERYLSRQEFERLSDALAAAQASGSESPHALAALWLLIFTGCRVSEILELRWEEVDFERRMLRLSDSKTGPKPVFLSSAALAILRRLPRTTGNPWVIEGRVPNTHLRDLNGPWRRLKQHAEIKNLRLHDLRHSFGAVGTGLGLSLPVIGKLLGHTRPETTARYAHLAAEPMQEAVERIGDYLAMLVGKSEPDSTAF